MTSTNGIYFIYGFYAYQTKARNPGNTVAATNPVFNHLMTYNDLNKLKIFQLWLYAYQTKARNPGKAVTATDPVFDVLLPSNDL